MSSSLLNPQPQNRVAPGYTPLKICPQCHSEIVVWLVQMRNIDDSRDYYRCRECGDEFTVNRPGESDRGPALGT
jgi:DNA-directed RNA polymerase subunit M/transcription elongation factor TFIIS